VAVTNRVHALVQQVQPRLAQPVVDRARADTPQLELPPRDHAVLHSRKLSNDPIDWAVFALHMNA
jgi:hypothetical protein